MPDTIGLEPKYYSVLLTEESRNLLLSSFKNIIPTDWEIYAHHMTILYYNDIIETVYEEKLVEVESFVKLNIGNKVNLVVEEIGVSESAIAVRVVTNIPNSKKIPHITLATHSQAKPVESNYIINWNKIDLNLILEGTITVNY